MRKGKFYLVRSGNCYMNPDRPLNNYGQPTPHPVPFHSRPADTLQEAITKAGMRHRDSAGKELQVIYEVRAVGTYGTPQPEPTFTPVRASRTRVAKKKRVRK